MLDSLAKLRLFVVTALIVLTGFTAQAKTLDDFINQIKANPQYDPFIIGGAKAKRHPLFSELMDFAKKFNTTVQWTPSVAQEVLKLPFHPDRMVIKRTESLDGWFDDLVSPNRIILHDEAAFITVIHELRHAVHLGSHGLTGGTAFDRLLQQNKRRTLKFQERLVKSDLSEEEKAKLKKLATRIVETASEVSAHQGDVVLSKQYGRDDYADSYLQYIQEYKAEFLEAYKALKKNPFSRNEAFLDEVYEGLREFMLEKGLKSAGLKKLAS